VSEVSVVILTFNEEATIGACIESVSSWAKEVFVVDSGSTDRTVEICKKHGAKVVQHPFDNYSAQRNWAIENLPLKGDWELHLDADERATPEIRISIDQELRSAPADVSGFMMSRRTIFMGRFIRFGGHYPVYHLRLFRRGKGRCENRLYDQHFIVAGKTQKLRGDIIDTVTSNLNVWTDRHNRWTSLEASQLMSNGSSGQVRARLDGNPIERRRWLRHFYGRFPLFTRAFLYFAYRYVLRLGFLDGTPGLIFHFLQGFWCRFLTDAKIYELKHAPIDPRR
jgi:glycosyltransferase involved in cell wall biosynthesis